MSIFQGVLLYHHPPGNAALAFLERAFPLLHLHMAGNQGLRPRWSSPPTFRGHVAFLCRPQGIE